MKSIVTPAIIEGIRSRKDKSLGVSFTTPELSSVDKAAFMDLQSHNVRMVIEPMDEVSLETHTIDTDLNTKSQSVRMRSILFILWKQDDEGKDFQTYYHDHTEKIINFLKEKIQD